MKLTTEDRAILNADLMKLTAEDRAKVNAELTKAKDLLKDPKNWTSRVFARNKEGWGVSACDPQACQFCVWGALTHLKAESKTKETLRKISYLEYGEGEARVNDTMGYEAVIRLLDYAIEATK